MSGGGRGSRQLLRRRRRECWCKSWRRRGEQQRGEQRKRGQRGAGLPQSQLISPCNLSSHLPAISAHISLQSQLTSPCNLSSHLPAIKHGPHHNAISSTAPDRKHRQHQRNSLCNEHNWLTATAGITSATQTKCSWSTECAQSHSGTNRHTEAKKQG